MFYYPEVLQRRSGCFGVIWLAATCSSRLVRREYLRVDVPHTCAALVAFVNGRSGWEVPPPPPGAPPPRCSLYLAALLQLGLVRVFRRQCGVLLEEVTQVLARLHRALPPARIDLSPPRQRQLVGDALAQMAALELAPDPFFGVMVPELPSPTALPQWLLEELPPAEVPLPPEPALAVSPEIITLREAEPLVPLAVEEEELPEVTLRELELLAEMEAEMLVPAEELPEVPPPPPLPPVPRPPEEPALPPPPPPPKAPPRRRRRLPHIDPQTQIPREEFKAQLLQPHAHCQPLVLLEPPHKRRRTPKELLQTPTFGWLPPELRDLWDHCARPAPRPVPPAPPELPSEVEVLREVLEPSLPVLPSSEVSLEVTEEELRPRLPPPEERRPLLPPPPPPPLLELPEALPPTTDNLRRLVAAAARREGGAELGELLPPGTPRRLVGRLFSVCLELCGEGLVRLEQAQPYGPIAVGPGPRGPPPASPMTSL